MAAAVYNIHHRNRKTVTGYAAKETVQRNIKRNRCCSCCCDGYSQDCICTQFGFIFGSISLDHRFVDGISIGCIHTGQYFINDGIDILYCFGNSFSKVSALVAIS